MTCFVDQTARATRADGEWMTIRYNHGQRHIGGTGIARGGKA